MNVLVTGASGFVAGRLAAHLSGAGHGVAGTTSRVAEAPACLSPERAHAHRFGEPVEPSWFAGIDAVVHCAHVFAPGSEALNVAGTQALSEAAAEAGVRRQLFVSSLSARPDAAAEYGRTKYALELWFAERGHTLVRPGTVLGPGGLFGRIADTLRRWPVVPLLDGGRNPMTVIGVADLCRALTAVLEDDLPGPHDLYCADRPTLRQVLSLLARLLGRRVLWVPVPSALLVAPMLVLRRAGVRLPVDVDNLRGYRKAAEGMPPSNLAELLPAAPGLEASLRESFGLEPGD